MIRPMIVSFQTLVLSAAAILLLMASGTATAKVVNVIDHGAISDGTTLNTTSFKKAVAACVKQNGGTVLVPAGVYRTGPIQLQSNVTLWFEAGAVIQGSEEVSDYRIGGGRIRPLVCPWCGLRTP